MEAEIMEKKEDSLCMDADPRNWEYDGGSPNWTGEIDKLSPYIREVQEKLVKEAFGDRQKQVS
jgi:hypothetical protein